jgi:hypothetical protein
MIVNDELDEIWDEVTLDHVKHCSIFLLWLQSKTAQLLSQNTRSSVEIWTEYFPKKDQPLSPLYPVAPHDFTRYLRRYFPK